MRDDDFPWGWACAVACAIAVIIMIGGAGGGTSTNSHNNNRTDVRALNDNHVLSDNGLYLFSEVQECNGAGACVTVVVTNTTTVRNGQAGGNVIVGSDGTPLCQNPATGIYSTCEAQP